MSQPFHHALRTASATRMGGDFFPPLRPRTRHRHAQPRAFSFFRSAGLSVFTGLRPRLMPGRRKGPTPWTPSRCSPTTQPRWVQVERNLHTNWSDKLGLTPQDLAHTERAPVTHAYTRHLLAVAQSGSLAEIVAAVLPCYWIYWEVGKKLNATPPTGPLYAEWTQAYSGEGFGAHVQQQLALIGPSGPGQFRW